MGHVLRIINSCMILKHVSIFISKWKTIINMTTIKKVKPGK